MTDVRPPDQLCSRCQTLDFKQWFFPSSWRDEVNHRQHEVLYFPDGRKLRWADVLATYEQCAFCNFLIDALALDPEFRTLRATEDLARFDGGIEMSAELAGTVSSEGPTPRWRVGGSDWVSRSPDSCQRAVKRVRASPGAWIGNDFRRAGWGVRIWPAVDPEKDVGDEFLLHARPLRHISEIVPLIRSWLDICSTGHKLCSMERTPAPALKGTPFRLIDVENDHIAEIEAPGQYLALSYCWGDQTKWTDCLRLSKNNAEELQKPGAVMKHVASIPRTIRDALILTRALSYQYLWVDVLCIVQDDEHDVRQQVRHMDSVYKHATMTIVAPQGAHSTAGLPGLSVELGRDLPEITRCIGGMWMCAHRSLQPELSAVLWKAPWTQRAWTFQEHFLSRRCLFFAKQGMFFECETAVFQATVLSEPASVSTSMRFFSEYAHALRPKAIGRRADNGDAWTAFQAICNVMSGLSARSIAYESERLDAMRGMLNSLEPHHPNGFVWGMPVDAIDSVLLFEPGIRGEAPYQRRVGFPSWTWLGWRKGMNYSVVGAVGAGFAEDSPESQGILLRPQWPHWSRKAVAFFIPDGALETWKALESSWILGESSFYHESLRRWSTGLQGINPRMRAVAHALSIRRIPTSHVLAFWTQVVYLPVDFHKCSRKQGDNDLTNLSGERKCVDNEFLVRTPSGISICYLGMTQDCRDALAEKLKFILIAHNVRWQEHLGRLNDVLLVNTVDGLTSRVTTVRDAKITTEVWDTLNPTWEFITMI